MSKGGEAWEVDIGGGARRNSVSNRGAPSFSSRVPSQSPGPTGSRFARPTSMRAADDIGSSPSKNPLPVTSSSRKDFAVGATVRIKRKDLPGYEDNVEIVRKHPEGTYDVRYKNGNLEKEVAAVRIAAPLESSVSSSRDGESKTQEGASEAFRMGQKIEAQYKRGTKFYPGRIMSVNPNGSLDIKYDDGEEEKAVPPLYVKPAAGSPRSSTTNVPSAADSDTEGDPRYRVGDFVEARREGNIRWVSATIINFDRAEGTYHLRYTDGLEERRVKYKLIRRAAAGAGATREEGSARRLNETDAAKAKLQEGAKVEANYRGRGKWYPGKIVRDRFDGTFDVDYEDGEKETRVDKDLIRLRDAGASSSSSSKARLEEGAKVEANYRGRGKFYPGKITRVRANGTFDVDYDDGEKELGLTEDLIRLRDGGVSSSSSRAKLEEGAKVEANYRGRGKWYPGKIVRDRFDGTFDVDYEDGEKETRVAEDLIRLRDSPSSSSRSRFEEGAKVEANYRGRGKFYPGKIYRTHSDGSYDIDYDDGEKETRVSEDLIRLVAPRAASRDRTPSPKPSYRQRDPEFSRGDKIEAKPRGSTRWVAGTVARAHSNGSYDIDFVDGERESGVDGDHVRRRDDREVRSSYDSRRDRERDADEGKSGESHSHADLSRLLAKRSAEAIRSMCSAFQAASTDKTCRKIFEEADESPPTGALSKKEFKAALRSLFSATYEQHSRSVRSSRDRDRDIPASFDDWLADNDMQNLLDGLAYSKNGTIAYDDFLLFALEPASGDSEQVVEVHSKMSKEVWLRSKLRLKDVIKLFSSSRTVAQGYVRVSEFEKVVRKIYSKATTKDVEVLVARFDPAKDGTVDFNLFAAWLHCGRVPEESREKWVSQAGLLESRAVESALLKYSSGGKGDTETISDKGLLDAAAALGLCLGSCDLRAVYASLDPEDKGRVTVTQVLDLTSTGRGGSRRDDDGDKSARRRATGDKESEAALLPRALRDDLSDALKEYLKNEEKAVGLLLTEQVTDSTRSTSASGSGNVCLTKKHFRKVLSKLSCQLREEDEGLLYETLDFEGKGSVAADDVLLYLLGLAYDNDSLEAADALRETLLKKKVPAKEVLRQLSKSAGKKDDTGYVESGTMDKILRKLSGGASSFSDDQMSDLLRFVDPEKHGLVDVGYITALCLVANDAARAEAKLKNCLRIMRLRGSGGSATYRDALSDEAREDEGRSMSVDALIDTFEVTLALPLTRCELQQVATKYQKRGRINVEALCDALEAESDKDSKSRAKAAAGKEDGGIGRSMFKKLCKLRAGTSKAALEQLEELRQGILEQDKDLVGRITRRELQRLLDRYADLTDEESALLEENLGFPDGMHSHSVDYPLLLLVLAEPVVTGSGATMSPAAAGVAVMKKMTRGGDNVGMRRLLELLFRNIAAADGHGNGVVTIDRAEKVILEECPTLDAAVLDSLLTAFLDKSSDCVKYPELLSFLGCCSNWAVLQRFNQLDLIRQKQGYHFKDFLLKSSKKFGKKLDAIKFADMLLGLGILMPETAMLTIFANFADKATKSLKVETFVASLEDAAGGDGEKSRSRVRNEVPEFAGGKDGKCPIAASILKAYDERVTRAVQLAFDSLDKNNSNELPDTDLERVLCCLGFSATVDEMDDLLAKIDRKGSGLLEYNEFMLHVVAFIRSKYPTAAEQSIEKLKTFFSSLDMNGDGTLSHSEFQHAVSKTSAALTEAEIAALVSYLDVDRDGVVSFAEFSLLYSLLLNEKSTGSSKEINALPTEVRSGLRKIQYSSMPQPETLLTMFAGLPSSFRQSVLAEQVSKNAACQLDDIVRQGGMLHVGAEFSRSGGGGSGSSSSSSGVADALERNLAVSVKLNQMQFEVQVVRVIGVPSESDARSADVLHRCVARLAHFASFPSWRL